MGAWTERPPSAAMSSHLRADSTPVEAPPTGPDECCWRVTGEGVAAGRHRKLWRPESPVGVKGTKRGTPTRDRAEKIYCLHQHQGGPAPFASPTGT